MQRPVPLYRLALLLVAFAVAACAELPREGRVIADPNEDINRSIHAFNKAVDVAVVKPASEVYVAVTPELVRYLLANGVSNLGLPVDAANQLMQGRFMDALATVGRFGVNTVFGAAGLLDPATDFGLPRQRADFGQTLYVWGMPEGAYVELPIFGPSTRRDAVGRIVDYVIDPTTYFGFIVPSSSAAHAFTAVRGLDLLNRRAELAPQLDPLLYSSADSYTELKNSYVQLRRRQLGMEQPADAALPDIFEDPAATQ